MLKAFHAQKSKKAARKKAREVVEKLKKMKLNAAAKKLDSIAIYTAAEFDPIF